MLFRKKNSGFFKKTLLSWMVAFHGVIISFAEVPGVTDKTASLLLRMVERAPVIDGNLSDPCWKNSPVAKDFIQRQPNEGQPVTEKTEVRVCRDDRTLFIGVRCFDSQPQNIAAKVMQRDAPAKGDDYFFILLDPYRRGREGYYFRSNPNGAKGEGLINFPISGLPGRNGRGRICYVFLLGNTWYNRRSEKKPGIWPLLPGIKRPVGFSAKLYCPEKKPDCPGYGFHRINVRRGTSG